MSHCPRIKNARRRQVLGTEAFFGALLVVNTKFTRYDRPSLLPSRRPRFRAFAPGIAKVSLNRPGVSGKSSG